MHQLLHKRRLWTNLKASRSRTAVWKDTRVAGPKTGPKTLCGKDDDCDWTIDTFEKLKWLIANQVPEGSLRRIAMERIEQRLDPTKALKGEDEMAKTWAARERESPTPEAYEKTLAKQWHELDCAAEGAPYVLHGLVAQLSGSGTSPFREQSDAAGALASDFLYKECAGAHGLSEADKAKLKEIAAQAPPLAAKL